MQLVTRMLVALVLTAGTAQAQSLREDSVRVQRLAAVGRLWGVVKYFHPAFLTRDVAWDSALVATIPRIRAAQTTSQYSMAVDQLLLAVRDEHTRVRVSTSSTIDPDSRLSADRGVTTRWEKDSTLIIRLPCVCGENIGALDAVVGLERVVYWSPIYI